MLLSLGISDLCQLAWVRKLIVGAGETGNIELEVVSREGMNVIFAMRRFGEVLRGDSD